MKTKNKILFGLLLITIFNSCNYPQSNSLTLKEVLLNYKTYENYENDSNKINYNDFLASTSLSDETSTDQSKISLVLQDDNYDSYGAPAFYKDENDNIKRWTEKTDQIDNLNLKLKLDTTKLPKCDENCEYKAYLGLIVPREGKTTFWIEKFTSGDYKLEIKNLQDIGLSTTKNSAILAGKRNDLLNFLYVDINAFKDYWWAMDGDLIFNLDLETDGKTYSTIFKIHFLKKGIFLNTNGEGIYKNAIFHGFSKKFTNDYFIFDNKNTYYSDLETNFILKLNDNITNNDVIYEDVTAISNTNKSIYELKFNNLDAEKYKNAENIANYVPYLKQNILDIVNNGGIVSHCNANDEVIDHSGFFPTAKSFLGICENLYIEKATEPISFDEEDSEEGVNDEVDNEDGEINVIDNVVSGGGSHTCALNSEGKIKCWGENSKGQLGNGTNTIISTNPQVGAFISDINGNAIDTSLPVEVKLDKKATSVVTGFDYSCALMADKTVSCWGTNNYGQLGIKTKNGVNFISTPVQVEGLSNVKQISAGNYHICALMENKNVKCWGNNDFGQLGDANGLAWENSVASVVAGGSYSCVLFDDGKVQCWGLNNYGQLGHKNKISDFEDLKHSNGIYYNNSPLEVQNLKGKVIKITAGADHVCAIMENKNVQCWGNGLYNNLGIDVNEDGLIDDLKDVIDISAGNDYTCALLQDDTVKCWGINSVGQLGNGTTTTGSAFVQEKKDNDLINLSNVKKIATGSSHTCALINDGKIKCWGYNSDGQLGSIIKDNNFSTVPVEVQEYNYNEESTNNDDSSCGEEVVYKDKTYPTVKIGEQCWMAKNLNVGDMLTSVEKTPSDANIIEKWCYDNLESNCTNYGGLYSWDEAMQGSIIEKAQDICPEGWHVPTKKEWETLAEFQSSTGCAKIVSGTFNKCMPAASNLISGGSSNFNAIYTPLRTASTDSQHPLPYFYLDENLDNDNSNNKGSAWWSSDTDTDIQAWDMGIVASMEGVGFGANKKNNGYSVRCIKD